MAVSERDIRKQLIDLVEPVCGELGYELVDITYVREPGGWVVRLFIDKNGQEAEPHPELTSAINFDDCEHVSRMLSALLDEKDPLPHAYRLEVSSPGLDRPLRTEAHFQRYVDHMAKLRLHDGVDGRRNFKGILRGVQHAPESSALVAIEVDGDEFQLPLSDIASARVVPDWSGLMAQSTKVMSS